MDEQFFRGVYTAFLGANFINAPITEKEIDLIKEFISHFEEERINRSPLSYQEKEDQKRQMKQSLEAYIHGVKETLRAGGRLL